MPMFVGGEAREVKGCRNREFDVSEPMTRL
jgi:hypothetical protein